ncbi:MAG: hypothetical protein H7A49_12645 [Akkermansiaceae bacterium]|nr:hypothetical protein [Akkermansiaceae bacterium]MCP5545884.1 hypothetical protein [Akkermansiaceae bacterium]
MSPPVEADAAIPRPRREAPWHAGLRAARANVVPGLLVQAAMLGVALAYRFYPPTTDLLDQLASWKARWGYGYSALTAIVAGAFLPELMRIAVFQRGRAGRRNLRNLGFTIPFWAFMGVVVDGFYRLQASWFGADAEFSVVVKKVLVDQFVYNPLFAAPFTAMMYDWKNRGFPPVVREFFTAAYYRDVVVPTLFATWGVWIPLVSIIYSLPSLLQIPLFGLSLSLWVMLYTWMSETRAGAR